VNLSKILNPNGWVAASHRQIAMKTTSTNSEIFESTYALLLRSEEKQRSRFETLIYTILAVSTIFAVLQFGREAAMMPSSIAHVSTTVSAPAQHGA
jgi:hypothetical protein